MNINTYYSHQSDITNKSQKEENVQTKETSGKEGFDAVQNKEKTRYESFLSNVNMPTHEKVAFAKALNEMDEKESSVTLMSVMAPSSMDATPESEFFSYDEIMKRIDNILNPAVGGTPDSELQGTLTLFKELFDKNFNEISEQNEQNRSLKDRETQLAKAKLLTEESV